MRRNCVASASANGFLAQKFGSKEDLREASYMEVEQELTQGCADLEALLSHLDRKLCDTMAVFCCRSDRVQVRLRGIKEALVHLNSIPHDQDNEEEQEAVLAAELPALAKEVARIDAIRAYAETALKLDSLIGDVEDSVSSSVSGMLRSSSYSVQSESLFCSLFQENHQKTISYLKEIESILTSIAKMRPQWMRLVSAVDNRVDRALAVLRPQCISDHRSLLASLGWPPPLSGSNLMNTSNTKPSEFSNPLFSLKGDLKTKYSESFLSLCNLQQLQRRRKCRQLAGHNLQTLIRPPLWVIEELVNPISILAERHFSKWVDKPEFVFALVYKITRDFVDSMDEVLQPLVDKANLVGYSCREEWIGGTVASLCTYLAKVIFPRHIEALEKGGPDEISSNARALWLNLVDLMISFDKRTQALISDTGLLMSLKEDETLQRVSSLSVFCDRPDWFEVWAEVEKLEVLEKFKPALEKDKNWTSVVSDENKSPVICDAIVQNLSLLIDRARSLPSVMLRAKFIRLTCGPVISEFIDCMVHRCQEAEGLTALTDDDALLKVVRSINAAQYFEVTLMEWCEDLFFLDMESLLEEAGSKCIFHEEISRLKDFRIEWVEKISTVILRGFDARTRDYVKNKKQWQEKMEGYAVSRTFLDSLDYVQGKLSKLEGLNALDFVTVWRGVANGIDQLIFNGVLLGGVKYNNCGVERLDVTVSVLFGVFKAWCLRPEGFFSKLHEGLRILKMDEIEIRNGLVGDKEKWLKEKGFRRLTIAEAERLVKNRVFEG
ncbi:RINT1-like protein MAG2 [Rhynchospora pubera]|uniref:RINT1-like protein MAG2 n=1 Tax=Rhynchospora pubera TaxID=906938 RepID=A0AAV8HDI2_9POAL|nr:RINT1-like protein MAG2 [Rhynchospora pubera]